MPRPIGSREKILQCAMEQFHLRGYRETSVDDLLRDCGVAKSNFYYHFRTKEELALATLESYYQKHEAQSRALLQSSEGTPLTRIVRYLEAVVHSQLEPVKAGCPFGNFASRLVCESQLSGGEIEKQAALRKSLAQFFEKIEAELVPCLLEGQTQGEIRNDLSERALAALILASLQGWMILAKVRTDLKSAEENIKNLSKILKK